MAIIYVSMDASALSGRVTLNWTGQIAIPASGRISIDQRDVPAALAMGMNYVRELTRMTVPIKAPAAASAGRIVASTALANGTLAIANQPDVPRQALLRIDPGAAAITAGNCAINYVANNGLTVVESMSLITASGTLFSTTTSYGMIKLNSAIVTGLAGGASPKIQVNDTNSLSLIVDPGFTSVVVLREDADGANETIGTVVAAAASVTPTTVPNGTHTYAFYYNYEAPDA